MNFKLISVQTCDTPKKIIFCMDKIALFPLSLVVFPGEELRLHIFEPRYKQLIHDCTTDNITFGIPPYFEGKAGFSFGFLILSTFSRIKFLIAAFHLIFSLT